jgi:hypothetical protein
MLSSTWETQNWFIVFWCPAISVNSFLLPNSLIIALFLSYNDKLVNHMAGYIFMIPVWDHGCDILDAS